MNKPLLIIKAGEKLPALDTVAGDFEDWMTAGMGLAPDQVLTVPVHKGATLPSPGEVAALLITGSSAMVTDHSDWIEATAAWLRQAVAAGVPTLGICFGHQLLAHALGGVVADNPRGIEVGSVWVSLTPAAVADRLLGAMPTRLQLHASHRQSVLTLPPGATCLASSDQEQHHAFAWGEQAWGLQFHPEFSAPVTRAYVDYYRDGLNAEGKDGDEILAACTDTPHGAILLNRFARLAGFAAGN